MSAQDDKVNLLRDMLTLAITEEVGEDVVDEVQTEIELLAKNAAAHWAFDSEEEEEEEGIVEYRGDMDSFASKD